MKTNTVRLLLADDDEDDCYFFKEALEGLSIATTLQVVHDGVQLTESLHDTGAELPDILFLDLNMPLKNGYECLLEVRLNARLRLLPVIVLSTFISSDIEEKLYRSGASHCIIKPTNVVQLTGVIQRALALTTAEGVQPARDSFIIKATQKTGAS